MLKDCAPVGLKMPNDYKSNDKSRSGRFELEHVVDEFIEMRRAIADFERGRESTESEGILMRRIAELNERLKQEDLIQHAKKQESLRLFAGGIAHGFNNLLTGVILNTSLALTELPPDSSAREYVRRAELDAIRAAGLTKRMLTCSGADQYVIESVGLNDILEKMTPLLLASIAPNVVMKLNLSDDLPSVRADAKQIEQVIRNLIANASEAIGEKSGVITLSTRRMGGDGQYLSETQTEKQPAEGMCVCLEVSDTGIGMDGETQKQAFDPFFTTKFTGRGLGLSEVLGIVRGHKGAIGGIRMWSKPGRGTTVRVSFPRRLCGA